MEEGKTHKKRDGWAVINGLGERGKGKGEGIRQSDENGMGEGKTLKQGKGKVGQLSYMDLGRWERKRGRGKAKR